MTYEQWLKERQGGIGGSDASSILGLNPYKTNVELWQEKTGRKTPADISGQPYVRYGKAAEKHMLELFRLDYPEYDVIAENDEDNYIVHKHPDYPFLFATLDGILTEIETSRQGIYEGKTTNILQSMHREKWQDKIPDNYYIQVLHYLLVKPKFEFAKLNARLLSKWEKEVKAVENRYHIERSEKQPDLDILLEAEIKFVEYNIKKDKPPALILPPI